MATINKDAWQLYCQEAFKNVPQATEENIELLFQLLTNGEQESHFQSEEFFRFLVKYEELRSNDLPSLACGAQFNFLMNAAREFRHGTFTPGAEMEDKILNEIELMKIDTSNMGDVKLSSSGSAPATETVCTDEDSPRRRSLSAEEYSNVGSLFQSQTFLEYGIERLTSAPKSLILENRAGKELSLNRSMLEDSKSEGPLSESRFSINSMSADFGDDSSAYGHTRFNSGNFNSPMETALQIENRGLTENYEIATAELKKKTAEMEKLQKENVELKQRQFTFNEGNSQWKQKEDAALNQNRGLQKEIERLKADIQKKENRVRDATARETRMREEYRLKVKQVETFEAEITKVKQQNTELEAKKAEAIEKIEGKLKQEFYVKQQKITDEIEKKANKISRLEKERERWRMNYENLRRTFGTDLQNESFEDSPLLGPEGLLFETKDNVGDPKEPSEYSQQSEHQILFHEANDGNISENSREDDVLNKLVEQFEGFKDFGQNTVSELLCMFDSISRRIGPGEELQQLREFLQEALKNVHTELLSCVDIISRRMPVEQVSKANRNLKDLSSRISTVDKTLVELQVVVECVKDAQTKTEEVQNENFIQAETKRNEILKTTMKYVIAKEETLQVVANRFERCIGFIEKIGTDNEIRDNALKAAYEKEFKNLREKSGEMQSSVSDLVNAVSTLKKSDFEAFAELSRKVDELRGESRTNDELQINEKRLKEFAPSKEIKTLEPVMDSMKMDDERKDNESDTHFKDGISGEKIKYDQILRKVNENLNAEMSELSNQVSKMSNGEELIKISRKLDQISKSGNHSKESVELDEITIDKFLTIKLNETEEKIQNSIQTLGSSVKQELAQVSFVLNKVHELQQVENSGLIKMKNSKDLDLNEKNDKLLNFEVRVRNAISEVQTKLDETIGSVNSSFKSITSNLESQLSTTKESNIAVSSNRNQLKENNNVLIKLLESQEANTKAHTSLKSVFENSVQSFSKQVEPLQTQICGSQRELKNLVKIIKLAQTKQGSLGDVEERILKKLSDSIAELHENLSSEISETKLRHESEIKKHKKTKKEKRNKSDPSINLSVQLTEIEEKMLGKVERIRDLMTSELSPITSNLKTEISALEIKLMKQLQNIENQLTEHSSEPEFLITHFKSLESKFEDNFGSLLKPQNKVQKSILDLTNTCLNIEASQKETRDTMFCLMEKPSNDRNLQAQRNLEHKLKRQYRDEIALKDVLIKSLQSKVTIQKKSCSLKQVWKRFVEILVVAGVGVVIFFVAIECLNIEETT